MATQAIDFWKHLAKHWLRPDDLANELIHPELGLLDALNEVATDTVTTAIVKKNRARSLGFFNATVEMIAKGPEGDVTQDVVNFAAMGAFGQLTQQEETIIREDWDRSKGKDDGLTDLDEERKVYAEMRAKLKAAVTNFDECYEQGRKSHNECERANLDNSKGHLFCFVLPKFNEDGTHEPWGEHDVPWAN